ncbi:uncharacterized protein LOC143428645 [Xylocopa sonorina]|uniref:uncharacterized protein LOC143428645 n=1 Tax=Xylocopa sonorina TaxID=1818115 RepID=UPI00403AA85F
MERIFSTRLDIHEAQMLIAHVNGVFQYGNCKKKNTTEKNDILNRYEITYYYARCEERVSLRLRIAHKMHRGANETYTALTIVTLITRRLHNIDKVALRFRYNQNAHAWPASCCHIRVTHQVKAQLILHKCFIRAGRAEISLLWHDTKRNDDAGKKLHAVRLLIARKNHFSVKGQHYAARVTTGSVSDYPALPRNILMPPTSLSQNPRREILTLFSRKTFVLSPSLCEKESTLAMLSKNKRTLSL